MRKGRQFYIQLLICLLVIAGKQSYAAQAIWKADSTAINIGDHLHLTLLAKTAASQTINWPVFKDSIGPFELLNAAKIDTAISGDGQQLSQQFTVSLYDSGNYYTPGTWLQIGGDSILAEGIMIRANAPEVDTARAIKPLKELLEVPLSWQEVLPYVLGVLLLLGLGLLAYYLYRKYFKKQAVVAERFVPQEPAHVWALQELEKLEQEKLWQRDEIKKYYTRLTDIMRMYLEYRYQVMAMESTTDEIADLLAAQQVPIAAAKELLDMLRMADLVKFAKLMPLPDAHTRCMQQSKSFVQSTIPIVQPSQSKA